MERQAYLDALRRLGLTPHSQETAERLGISVRTASRYATGERPPTRPVQLVLEALLREQNEKENAQ
jgi:transcriptional regulator with XRE-family HTH domain